MPTNSSTELVLERCRPAITILIVILCVLVNPVLAQDNKTTIRTTAGDLIIKMGTQRVGCGVFLNRKEVIKLDCDGSYLPRVLKAFKGNFGAFDEVLILQEVPAGNACNGGPLHIVALSKLEDSQPSAIGPIDFCGGKDPVIKREADKIIIIFPGGPPNRGTGVVPEERWMYQNGRIVGVR